jgi:hypothetical protein
LHLLNSFYRTPVAAMAAIFGTWPCSTCLGGDGKPFRCKGALTRCPKCQKGPAPGARRKLEKGGGKGKGGGSAAKGDKSTEDKYFTLVQASLKGIQAAMCKQEKRIDEILGAPATGTASEAASPPAANPALDSFKEQLKDYKQHLVHAKDPQLVEFLQAKIDILVAQVKEEQDKTTSPSELTYNLAGDTLKDFQATRSKVQRLLPAIEKAKKEVEELVAKREAIDKAITDKMAEESVISKELEAAEGKLEKFAKAALSETVLPAVAPTDINLLIKGAQQLTVAAEAQLSSEGAGEFKKIMNALTEFNAKLPKFFATNLGVPADDEVMDDDEDNYLDEELEEASKVAEAAALGAAPNAKVERVRCHAYTTKLNSLKRARVIKAKKAGQLG